MPQSIRTQIKIINARGLHARAAAKLVATASRFVADITVTRNQDIANAKSILGLMMLAASQGSRLELTATGSDADAAIAAIKALTEAGVDETEA